MRVAAVVRRRIDNDMVAVGLQGDGRKRWAVESILSWRGDAKCRREALVMWKGVDRETGEPRPAEWVPIGRLTSDLQQTDPFMRAHIIPKPAAPRPAVQADGRQVRATPRLAGVTPVDGLEREPRRAQRQMGSDRATMRARQLVAAPSAGLRRSARLESK